MSKDPHPVDLTERVRAAAGGDKAAAREVLDAISDDVYELALRMLGHPADAEDAAQEILVVVLTHLSSFRGESAFQTWVWRIAANHLARVRRGRRETITFEILDDRLRTGLREESSERPDPEAAALAAELRLRCTEAMILSLDRDKMVRYRGRVAMAGFLGGGAPLTLEPLTQLQSGVHFSFFASAFMFGGPDLPLSQIPFADFVACADRGVYRSAPAHVFDFDQIVEAHRLMESSDARGKIVVRVPQ
jgi:RNA polymerase sigma factor (sigma-70 family)